MVLLLGQLRFMINFKTFIFKLFKIFINYNYTEQKYKHNMQQFQRFYWVTVHIMFTSENRSPTQRHTRCLPSARYRWSQDSSTKSTFLQRASGHRRWAFAHWSWLLRRTVVQWARRWASLRRFLTVCANPQFHQLSRWLVSRRSILQVKKLDVEFLGWCGYTRSAVVRPVGCTPKFSKTTELMVETLTLHSLATALVDIAAVSMPIARSLKTVV